MQYHFDPAELSPEKLQAIQQLEKDQDIILIAVEPESELTPAPTLAKLTPEEVMKVQMLEKELNQVLVAYSNQTTQ